MTGEADIRSYAASDLPALYRICLLTGASGRDASSEFTDPDLLGHFYAAPYAVSEPDLCFVALDTAGDVAGYVLGTPDSGGFAAWCERAWFPALRSVLPLPDPGDQGRQGGLLRLIHGGYQAPSLASAYPAHLHIDLLPVLQGRGVGRRLMAVFLAALRVRGVPGVHLGVSTANPGAIAFYERLGFACLETHPGWKAYGMRL